MPSLPNSVREAGAALASNLQPRALGQAHVLCRSLGRPFESVQGEREKPATHRRPASSRR